MVIKGITSQVNHLFHSKMSVLNLEGSKAEVSIGPLRKYLLENHSFCFKNSL